MSERRFLFLLGSARTGGNTETLARHAAEQLHPLVEQRWLRLADLPLPAFRDIRHEGDGQYPAATGHEKTLLEATLLATDIVIASPLYWYSVSASTKMYLDYWSAWMRIPHVEFKPRMGGKTLWGITALSDDDPAVAQPLAGTLRHTANYLGMRWGGVLLGYGSRPGDIAADTSALTNAKTLFGPRQSPE